MKKALVIMSGGQDSTTSLFWAKKNFDEVYAITFYYGQNHSVETKQAGMICRMHQIKQVQVALDFLPHLVESALTSGGNVNEVNAKGLPASFVPNRNALFITLAHAYAQKIGAEHLVTGVCQTDYSGYPDCREAFIKALQDTLNLGSDSNITIHTPIMHINKAETFQLAEDLGYLTDIVKYSHTCYNGDRQTVLPSGFGCGVCPACVLREKGFQEYLRGEGKPKQLALDF